MDIIKVVENSKKVYMSESSLQSIMDFERVLDELDIYAFKNWKKGELVEGPVREKHWIEGTFMWPRKLMPDPDGGKRLLGYKIKVEYKEDKLKTPIKLEGPEDYRHGTKKPKLKEDPVWLVKIRMPIELIEDFEQGFVELEGEEIDLSEVDDAYQEGIADETGMEAQAAAGVDPMAAMGAGPEEGMPG
jgi:hypothetical protein